MKKILFTLAMLLMAGSAFADNYLYMDDIVLTKNFVQQSSGRAREINVPVKAHFEQWTNAFDVTFNYGTIECRGVATETVGDSEVPITPDMVLKGMNKQGKIVNITVALNSNADADHFIAANSVGGYYYPEGSDPDEDDPIQYGAVKWAPGDYECMFMLVLRIPQNFEEGDITVSSKFASGGDTRPGVETIPAEYANTPTVKVAHVSVIDNTPTISDDGEKVTAVFDGATTNVELYLKNGEEWVKVDNPYTLPEATDVDQVLVFKAITVPAEGAVGQLPAESEEYTVTIKAATPELQPAPKPTINNEGGVVTASVANDTQHEVVLEVWDAEKNDWVVVEDGSYELPDPTFADQTIKFRAYTKGIEGVDSGNSDYVEETVTIPAKADKVAPVPTIANNNGVVTATCAGHEVVLYVKNGENWDVVEGGSFPLPANNTFDDVTYEFKAYTVANGTDDNINSAEVTKSFTVEGKADAQAPKPTIKEENGVVTVIAPEEGLEVELYVKENGEWKLVNGGSYTLPTNDSYTDDITVDFYAITKPDGEKYNLPSDEEYYTATVDKLDKNVAQKPTIVGTNLTNTTKDIVITPDPNTDGTLVVEANPAAPGRAAAQTMTYERKDADYYVHVKAWTTAGETYLASEVAEEDILIPAKPAPKVYEVADPTISVDNSDPTKTVITIEATEGVLTYNIDAEEGVAYTVEEVEGKVIITVVNGDETAFVNVTATTTLTEVPAGYDEVKNGKAEKNVEIPQYQQTAAPTIDVSFGGEDGAHYANVTFVNNDAKPATIEYSLDNGKTWNTYTPGVPVVINTYGETTVLARATAEGKATSEVAERSFTLSDDATSVNELVNGKTVAGVRYFNMAGQEMQEANGITIVVTTYTDGTTSAVKVIK